MTINGGSILGHPLFTWSGGGVKEGWFDVARNVVVVHRALDPGPPTPSQIQDRLYETVTGASTVTDLLWTYSVPQTWTGTVVNRSTSNASVIIPDPLNPYKWLWVSDGTADIALQSSGRTVTKTVTVSTSPGSDITTFAGYDPVSLRYAMHSFVNTKIRVPGAQMAVFQPKDPWDPNYVINTSCWGYGVDLTFKSYWNNDMIDGLIYGPMKGGTLISPRHVLMTVHFAIAIGSTLTFIKSDGTQITRTLTNVVQIDNRNTAYPDVCVGLLDSDVPEGINFARVLPDNYSAYLPQPISTGVIGFVGRNTTNPALPAVVISYFENMEVNDLLFMSDPNANPLATYGAMLGLASPIDTTWQQFYMDKIPGDSSSPVGLIIDNKFVVISQLTSGGSGSGTNLIAWKTQVNALMAQLGTSYQLTPVNLSSYFAYPQD